MQRSTLTKSKLFIIIVGGEPHDRDEDLTWFTKNVCTRLQSHHAIGMNNLAKPYDWDTRPPDYKEGSRAAPSNNKTVKERSKHPLNGLSEFV